LNYFDPVIFQIRLNHDLDELIIWLKDDKDIHHLEELQDKEKKLQPRDFRLR